MTFSSRALALSSLCLLAAGWLTATAQQPESGTGSSVVSPASAAPQNQPQPNLRTDSQPHTSLSIATDSGPAPETLGMDATPLMDIGLDWSLPQASDQPSVTREIVTHNGEVKVVEIATKPALPLPVTNPPDPPSHILEDVPQPPVKQMPTPQDPLAGIPQ
jgi:hypothetical protein